MNFWKKALLFAVCALTGLSYVHAEGWPANYQGVMLQGFYWDSYQNETKWSKLEAKADEYSKYFSLIWVPNSAKSSGGLGYMPVYWFTNHNSSMGSETDLRKMIATYKAKGVGIIEDVVINHRAGVSNWTNFPKEKWNGQEWYIGPEGICCDDEVANVAGQAKPTGARDTGEGYEAARDLDHTNANVQNNCKNYCKCLIEDFGYVGFRYDYAKGFGGQYIKQYNQYSKPKFSVGEFWDGNPATLQWWVDSTGKESAAFDFALKYVINNAFDHNNMAELSPNASYKGLVYCGYGQYAVTFIDNHDTYRDSNKFQGNVVAANAYILTTSGTPCVFLPHWNQYTKEISQLINVRNSVGIHNCSYIEVLQARNDCYMAKVKGTNGELVVKIGNAMESAPGYTDADIVASGNGYCVWTKVKINGESAKPQPVTAPSTLNVLGNLSTGSWIPNAGVKMTKSGQKFTASSVEFVAAEKDTYAYFSFAEKLGSTATDWDGVNSGNRYAPASDGVQITVGQASPFVQYVGDCNTAWKVAPGKYDITVDFDKMAVTVNKVGQGNTTDPDPTPDPTPQPSKYAVYFDNTQTAWPSVYTWIWDEGDGDKNYTGGTWPGTAISLDSKTGYYKYEFEAPGATKLMVIFSNGKTVDQVVGVDQTEDLTLVPDGIYNLQGFTGKTSVESIAADDVNVTPVYYNLQGVRVDNPTSGLYIVRRGNKVTKVIL